MNWNHCALEDLAAGCRHRASLLLLLLLLLLC
jgi:hypothetical protein